MNVPTKTTGATPVVKPPSSPEARIDAALMTAGKYEITPDQTFTVTFSIKEFKGRWVISDKGGKGSEEHSAVFRVWSYEEMVDLRKRATTYDPQKRMSIVDNDLLNRLKVQKLLQSWTLENDNPRLKINRVGGVMTDESWKAFTKVSPCILERIINEMNMVLDYGA